VIVDEVGTEAEALACRTIAERGVTLIATAHGCFLENLIKNPTLSDLIGGVQSVTLVGGSGGGCGLRVCGAGGGG
jgi:stage III sporulation protein SpoIIIAA